MPSLQLLNMFGSHLTKMSIVTSVSMTFSLVGLQAVMDVKFSCPCKADWNSSISALIFCAPAFSAFVIMLALLKPCKCSQKCKKCGFKVFFVCWIPSFVWICLCFIDGDYIACGFTTCNGRYACDKELLPYCFNWCKPTESPEKNETECYESTRKWIYISKILRSEELCRSTTHVKIIPQITAIAGFKQRWRQRGKTYGLQL